MDLEGLYNWEQAIKQQHGNTAEVSGGERFPSLTMTDMKMLVHAVYLLAGRIQELSRWGEDPHDTIENVLRYCGTWLANDEPPIIIEGDSWEQLEKDWEDSLERVVNVAKSKGNTLAALEYHEIEKTEFYGRAIAMIMDHFNCSYVGAANAFDDAYDDFFQTHEKEAGLYAHIGKWVEEEDNDYFGEPLYK